MASFITIYFFQHSSKNATCFLPVLSCKKKENFFCVDLQFPLEGHSYSICDGFLVVYSSSLTPEKKLKPQKWVLALQNSSCITCKATGLNWIGLWTISPF